MTISLANDFNDTGKIRDQLDYINGLYANVKTGKNAIVSQFDTSGFEHLICHSESAASALFDALDAAQLSYANLLKRRFTDRLIQEDYPRVGNAPELGLTTDQILARIWPAFWADMEAQAKTTRANSVTAGSVTTTKSNTNAGSLTNRMFLSGVLPPTTNGIINPLYFGVAPEMSKNDTCNIECVSDESNGGVARGYELFVVRGLPAQPAPFSNRYATDGDGTIAYMRPVQGASVVPQLGFDEYTVTANSPDGWVVNSGSVGTDIQEHSTAADVIGQTGSALKLTGSVNLHYPIPRSLIAGRSQLCVCFLIRKNGATGGTYTITVEGTGMTTVTTGALTASAESATVYGSRVLAVPVPASVPYDFKIRIATSSISGGSILIDHGGAAPYVYWNGIGLAIIDGHDPFVVSDRFQFAITNTFTGDNQTTFAKVFRTQAPSIDVGYDYA